MYYLLVEKTHNGMDFVHLGPITWKSSFFQSCLRDNFDLNVDLPLYNDTNQPFLFNDIARIIPVTRLDSTVSLNSKIQVEIGPFYNFFDTYAEMYYNVIDKDISVVKEELNNIVATYRYKYEVMGISVTIQNQSVNVLTNREDRGLYLQAYQLGKGNINWKFNTTFLTLSNLDLGIIVDAVSLHVQSAFDWEHLKNQEINNCTTLAELNAIILVSDNPVWEPVNNN